MEDKLLNISEAAKLMGVCENTLRDWDISGKFPCIRTAGGHRRYNLDQIREYVEKNPQEEPKKTIPSNHTEQLKQKWSDYLQDVENEQDQKILAVLFENTALYNETFSDSVLSLDQTLSLTKAIWLKIKFKKMFNVNPLLGPVGLVYYDEVRDKKVYIESDAVAAKSYKFNSVFYKNAPFDSVKDIYATAIAQEIDYLIVENLPRLTGDFLKLPPEDICKALDCDYIIGPKNLIEHFKGYATYSKIDYFIIDTILDKETLTPIVCAGKYPQTPLSNPKFCPYIFCHNIPTQLVCSSVCGRMAFYDGPKKK